MVNIEKKIKINAPVEEVYQFLENFENFQNFVQNIESIKKIDDTKSQWVIKGPFETKVEFQAETVEKIQNNSIKWESIHSSEDQSAVKSKGELKFEPEGDFTNLTVKFSYSLPNNLSNKITEAMHALGFPDKDFEKGLKAIKDKIEES